MRGKKQKVTPGELTAPNPSVPVKPLEPNPEPEKPTVQRPKYAQNMCVEPEKIEKKAEDFSEDSFNGERFTSFSSENVSPQKNNEPSSSNEEKPQTKKKKRRFHNNKKPGNIRQFVPRPVEPQVFKEMPESMKFTEYFISPKNYLPFGGPQHYLSALYPVHILVNGNSYNSVEHYYQACKLFTLAGKDIAQLLKTASTPIQVKQEVKKIIKQNKVDKESIEKWKRNDSVTVLEHIIYQKFKQNEELREMLMKTDSKILIQTYMGDNFFAANANQKTTLEWINSHAGETLKVPSEITPSTIEYCPLVVNGKNLLGFLTMKIREQLRREEIEELKKA